MVFITPRDRKFVKFMRDHQGLPDWDFAAAVRGYIEQEKRGALPKEFTTGEFVEWLRELPPESKCVIDKIVVTVPGREAMIISNEKGNVSER